MTKRDPFKGGKPNKRLALKSGDCWKPRVWHSPARGRKSPRLLVKCGCCDEKVVIYYDDDDLEINGVLASKAEWRRLLGPLLEG